MSTRANVYVTICNHSSHRGGWHNSGVGMGRTGVIRSEGVWRTRAGGEVERRLLGDGCVEAAARPCEWKPMDLAIAQQSASLQ